MEYYKYLPPERTSFFNTFLLRFSQRDAVNDPYECMPTFEEKDVVGFLKHVRESQEESYLKTIPQSQRRHTKKLLDLAFEKQKKRLTKNPEIIEGSYIDYYHKSVNDVIGIFSMSLRSDSSVMWAHYADNHRGFLIGMDSSSSFFKRKPNDSMDVGFAVNVKYREERPHFSVNKEHSNEDIFIIKNTDWSYEKEVRLIRQLKNSKKMVEDPIFKRPIHLFEIPKDCITSVTFGVQINEMTQSEIIETLNSDADLKHIEKFKAEICRKTFKINRVPL